MHLFVYSLRNKDWNTHTHKRNIFLLQLQDIKVTLWLCLLYDTLVRFGSLLFILLHLFSLFSFLFTVFTKWDLAAAVHYSKCVVICLICLHLIDSESWRMLYNIVNHSLSSYLQNKQCSVKILMHLNSVFHYLLHKHFNALCICISIHKQSCGGLTVGMKALHSNLFFSFSFLPLTSWYATDAKSYN